jgi:hypothetical protein
MSRSTCIWRIAACLAAAGAAASSGCGASASVKSAVDPVAQAAEVSERAPGFRATFSSELRRPGSPGVVSSQAAGVFDQRDHVGDLTVRVKTKKRTVTTETKYAKTEIYFRVPSGRSPAIAKGKRWVGFNVQRLGAALGISYSALTGEGTSTDPRQFLSYLRAMSPNVQRIGIEQVQGVPTTHYRGTLDFDQYPNHVAPAQRQAAKQSVAALERLTGLHTELIDAWVDQQHRVRREESSYTQCLPGTEGVVGVHVAVEFFDFGPQRIPSLPAEDEVADVTSYVAKGLAQLKPSCG